MITSLKTPLGNIRILTILILVALLISGCSSISVEGARQLSLTGGNVAVQAQQNIFVSDKEYLRDRDSEALLHGFSGTTKSVQAQASDIIDVAFCGILAPRELEHWKECQTAQARPSDPSAMEISK